MKFKFLASLIAFIFSVNLMAQSPKDFLGDWVLTTNARHSFEITINKKPGGGLIGIENGNELEIKVQNEKIKWMSNPKTKTVKTESMFVGKMGKNGEIIGTTQSTNASRQKNKTTWVMKRKKRY